MNCSNAIRLLLCTVIAVAILSSCKGQKNDSLPKPVGYVNDFENILSTSEERYLDSIIRDFENRTTNQIAIITVDTSMVKKTDFDNYILRIFNAWGVGQKEKNNGIVIGFSRSYRMIRIENGRGIEKILSNGETKTIVDSAFIPLFKKGLYFDGVVSGLNAIMQRLR